jgi:FG-GAP-like repeat
VADYPLGFQPGGIAVGDFNGDGLLDIAVTNSAKNGSVEVLLSNGNGTFIPRRSVVPLNSPTAILAADFNGDGKLDLAVKAAGGPPNYVVEVLLGKGDGSFQRRSALGGLDSMGGMTAGDFNGDGKLDIAIVDISRYGDAWLRLSLGNGDGTFQSTISTQNLHPQPSGIAAGDFNGDGNLDVAITNLDAGWDIRRDVDLLLGAGDGTLQFSSFYGPPSNFAGPIAADFNGDHKLDLAAARKDVGKEAVLLGDGRGSFQHPVYNFLTTASPSSPVLGDFNGDGNVDLLLSDTGSTLFTMLGEGNGRFQIQVSTQGAQMHQISAGDFNNDGALDLVAIGDLEISILTQEHSQ